MSLIKDTHSQCPWVSLITVSVLDYRECPWLRWVSLLLTLLLATHHHDVACSTYLISQHPTQLTMYRLPPASHKTAHQSIRRRWEREWRMHWYLLFIIKRSPCLRLFGFGFRLFRFHIIIIKRQRIRRRQQFLWWKWMKCLIVWRMCLHRWKWSVRSNYENASASKWRRTKES